MKPGEPTRPLRKAALLVASGLFVQLGCALYWSPGTFVVSAAVGAPLVLLGVVLGFVRSRGASRGGGA